MNSLRICNTFIIGFTHPSILPVRHTFPSLRSWKGKCQTKWQTRSMTWRLKYLWKKTITRRPNAQPWWSRLGRTGFLKLCHQLTSPACLGVATEIAHRYFRPKPEVAGEKKLEWSAPDGGQSQNSPFSSAFLSVNNSPIKHEGGGGNKAKAEGQREVNLNYLGILDQYLSHLG